MKDISTAVRCVESDSVLYVFSYILLDVVQVDGVFPQDLLSRQAPARVVGWGRTSPA